MMIEHLNLNKDDILDDIREVHMVVNKSSLKRDQYLEEIFQVTSGEKSDMSYLS